ERRRFRTGIAGSNHPRVERGLRPRNPDLGDARRGLSRPPSIGKPPSVELLDTGKTVEAVVGVGSPHLPHLTPYLPQPLPALPPPRRSSFIALVGRPIARATGGAGRTASVRLRKKLVLTIASASGNGSSIVGAPSVASSSLVRNTVLMPSRSHC